MADICCSANGIGMGIEVGVDKVRGWILVADRVLEEAWRWGVEEI